MERIIELVRKHPILYDLSHEDYKNIRKKDKVWTKIGEELGENGKLKLIITGLLENI